MTILALLYRFVCLGDIHWNQPCFHSRIACWGIPSLFKTALDLLTTDDSLALATWPDNLAWTRDKLPFLQPCPRLYTLRYRRNRSWYPQTR